ncbi:hypothetical protein GF380_01390 [Candidatus Uhrbacteria bacterium]|nr:hypothetical protein [Candidatus Uhrbacteria bacterium]
MDRSIWGADRESFPPDVWDEEVPSEQVPTQRVSSNPPSLPETLERMAAVACDLHRSLRRNTVESRSMELFRRRVQAIQCSVTQTIVAVDVRLFRQLLQRLERSYQGQTHLLGLEDRQRIAQLYTHVQVLERLATTPNVSA